MAWDNSKVRTRPAPNASERKEVGSREAASSQLKQEPHHRSCWVLPHQEKLLTWARGLCQLPPCHRAPDHPAPPHPSAGRHNLVLSPHPSQFLVVQGYWAAVQGSAPELVIRTSLFSAICTSKKVLGTSCPLTFELVQTAVVQGLLGLDQRPEMLVYQIPSQGEIFVLTAHRAASEWQRFRVGTRKAMLSTSLVNMSCKEKKGLVKEMAVGSSGPASR